MSVAPARYCGQDLMLDQILKPITFVGPVSLGVSVVRGDARECLKLAPHHDESLSWGTCLSLPVWKMSKCLEQRREYTLQEVLDTGGRL